MTLLQHEIDYIADRFLSRVEERLTHIIHREMKIMTDQAVSDLTAATDAIVAELGDVVTQLQTDAQALKDALANSSTAVDADIEAQAKRLTEGAAAAKAAVDALKAQPLPSPAPAGTAGGAGPQPFPGTAPVGEAAARTGAAVAEAGGAPHAPDPTVSRDTPASA